MIQNGRKDMAGGQSSQRTTMSPHSTGPTSIRGYTNDAHDTYQQHSSDSALWHTAKQTNPLSKSNVDIADLVSREPLLASTIIISAVIMTYEILVIALKPSWAPIATDWVRASLSWLELLPVLLAAVVLYRHRRPGMFAWAMFATAMLSYAIAQTAWAFLDRIIEPNNVPVPSQADLFYLLQYPFFFLGLALLPGLLRRGRPSIARAKIVLDSLLLMAAGTALSWYFILEPFYLQSGQSILGKATNMAYPVGDLGLLFGLTVVVISQDRQQAGQTALRLFIAAVACLIVADSIFLNQELYPLFNPGDLANGFWMASYLLFGFAGFVRFRAVQREVAHENAQRHVEQQDGPSAQIVRGDKGFQVLIPFLAAVIASALIVFRAAAIGDKNLVIPFLVSFGLLVLIGARQGVTVLENQRLLRNEQQRSEELAQAKQMAEQQRLLLAERNQRLQVDIHVLKDIHARVARGDYAARVPITSGELLPIAGSLNIMLDRLSKLIRASSEYARLEQAIQHMVVAVHEIAEGDDKALSTLSVPTNTPLDGVSIALRQVRTRIKNMETGLQRLEHTRKIAHELSERVAQQSHSISEETIVLSEAARTFNQLATELERVVQMLERVLGVSPVNKQMGQLVVFMHTLVETIRQQHTEISTQVLRLNQLETYANQTTVGSRRLSSELDAVTSIGENRMTTPKISQGREAYHEIQHTYRERIK